MNSLRVAMLVAPALLAACAPADAPETASAQSEGRQCFLASRVHGFSDAGPNAVNVRVGTRDYYRLELAGTCPEIDWALRAALRTRGGSSWICDAGDAELIVPSPGVGVERCPVIGVRKLSEAEVQALRAND